MTDEESRSRIRPGRYTVALGVLAIVIAWIVPFFVSWFVWVPVAIGVGVAAGQFGVKWDRKRQQTRHHVAPSGLMSTEKFAEVCASYAKPKVDPDPELPDAVPPALRDPAFQAWLEASSVIDRRMDDLKEMRWSSMRAGGRFGMSMYERHAELMFDLKAEATEVRAKSVVAERNFEPLTHCQRGHVADHWIGDTALQGERLCVQRTCRFTRCGVTWWEGA